MLPILAIITGGLTFGATYVGAGCHFTKEDAFKYLCSALVIVLALFIVYLANTHQLTVRTALLGWTVITALFVLIGFQLRAAPEGSEMFVRVMGIIAWIVAGVSAAIAGLVWYGANKVGADSMTLMEVLALQLDKVKGEYVQSM